MYASKLGVYGTRHKGGGACQWLCRNAASITLSRLDKTMSKTPSQTETAAESATPERSVVPASGQSCEARGERPAPDPTRYGDWEKNGRCIDF
jgi:hypothetical protein